MSDKYPGMARREFLAAIGKAVGGSAMLRAMAAMGISISMPGRHASPNIMNSCSGTAATSE